MLGKIICSQLYGIAVAILGTIVSKEISKSIDKKLGKIVMIGNILAAILLIGIPFVVMIIDM